MEEPRVSFVIPAKDEEDVIGLCLQSIARLDYPPDRLEVVVVDDGSRDGTAAVAAAHGAIVVPAPGTTIAAARNAGARRASGEVLAFIDADISVPPGWLRHGLEVLARGDVGAVGGPFLPPPDTTWVDRTWYLSVSLRPRTGEIRWLGSGAVLIRRDLFQEIGGWNESLETCEDMDLGDRIQQSGHVLWHDEALGVIHHGGCRTLTELFRKEAWRGKDVFRRLAITGWTPTSLSSVVQSGWQAVCLVGAVASFLVPPWRGVTLWFLAASLALPLLRVVWVVWRGGPWRHGPALLVFWYVYYAGRAWGILTRRAGTLRTGRRGATGRGPAGRADRERRRR